ncbi:GFA family protein [Aliirhizobium smilacinae]|uniref:GFA family protein n=1 Tax=Aliirhizobium smilacinae TaxID=1395944 RepID=A0A5C4XRQ7_9HYPH|nr:GFA family protein [Rhizobium smilacinae]TNM65274.1 GFA family protein [Rhizobium smilacinae]
MSDRQASNTKRKLRGACQCGSVTYEVDDEFAFAVNCHCSICRRATGAAFKPLAGIEIGKLRVSTGRDDIKTIGANGWQDQRCNSCGSFLFAVVRDGTFAHIAMGTLLDDPTIRPQAHIFVGSKAPWFTITDTLPQYDQHIVADSV